MSHNMQAFDNTSSMTVSEVYDLTQQKYYSKRRCQCACGFLNRKVSFRVWKILLFLLLLLMVILLEGILIAFYGPSLDREILLWKTLAELEKVLCDLTKTKELMVIDTEWRCIWIYSTNYFMNSSYHIYTKSWLLLWKAPLDTNLHVNF